MVIGIWNELLVSVYQQRRQQAISSTPNRACRWLDMPQLEAQLGGQANALAAEGDYTGRFTDKGVRQPLAHHKCAVNLGQSSLGLTVFYFGSAEQAETYAAKVLNPQRSWSEGGQHEDRQGIFSFVIITDGGRGSAERVEAYTVKETAVLRFRVPCNAGSAGLSSDPGKCDAAAVNIVKSVLDNAQNNKESLPINPLGR